MPSTVKTVNGGGGDGNVGGKRSATGGDDGDGGKRSAASNPPAKKKKQKGKGKQITLLGAGMEKIDKAPLLLNQSTLFTDSIYGKTVPPEMIGQQFLYLVKSYDAETKEFTVKYRNNMIRDDGVAWRRRSLRRRMAMTKWRLLEKRKAMPTRRVKREQEQREEKRFRGVNYFSGGAVD